MLQKHNGVEGVKCYKNTMGWRRCAYCVVELARPSKELDCCPLLLRILQLLGHVEACQCVAAVDCKLLGGFEVVLTREHFDLRCDVVDLHVPAYSVTKMLWGRMCV